MTDFDSLRLGAIYAALGADTVITLRDGREETFSIIDKTAGVSVPVGDLSANSVKPAAAVRMIELADKSVSLDDVRDGQIDLNGKRWRIKDYLLRPGIGGEAKGEALLELTDERLP